MLLARLLAGRQAGFLACSYSAHRDSIDERGGFVSELRGMPMRALFIFSELHRGIRGSSQEVYISTQEGSELGEDENGGACTHFAEW